jgi:Secretion system C-terminal sorting domain
MKLKIFLLTAFAMINCFCAKAQTVRACIDTSTNYPNAVNIWLRSDATTPFDTCASSLQFSIAIPDTFSGTRPSTFVVDTSAWLGSTWIVNAPYLEAGYWHYDILTAYTPCMSYTANADYFAMRVSPVGGTATPYNYYLLCLPDGGATTGGALFYHYGAWKSNGSSLYFSRPGTNAVNQFSYDLSGATPGTGISYSNIIKPNPTAPTVRACMDTVANFPNAINLWLRADITTPFDTCASSLQFSIAIPDTFSGTRPSTFVVDTSAWAGSTWIVNAPYLEAGFWHYDILTSYTPCMNYTANVDYFAMRISPVGGNTTPANYYLLCLPDGGATTGGALFYHYGAWKSDGSSLFFARPGTQAINAFSYDLSGASAGTSISYSTLLKPTVALALQQISLTASWQNSNDALLHWQVNMASKNVKNYIIAKSTNAIDFSEIKSLSLVEFDRLNFADVMAKVDSKNIYYRITANLQNGSKIQSNVAVLTSSIVIRPTVFPVPASNFINIIDIAASAQIALYDAAGKIIIAEKCIGSSHVIDVSTLAEGLYTIKITDKKGSSTFHKVSKVAQ